MKQEIDDLHGLSRFTESDRCFFFDLNPAETNAVDRVHTSSVAIHLILQIGYFKAKHQFFTCQYEKISEDLQYIHQRYFPERK